MRRTGAASIRIVIFLKRQGRLVQLFILALVLLSVSLGLLVNTLFQVQEIKEQTAEVEARLGNYAVLRDRVNTRLGIDDDRASYVTPDDPDVAALVQEVTGGFDADEHWRDYQRLSRWVFKNISYSQDSHLPVMPETPGGALGWENDFWRLPAETIRDGTGDCEDVSTLLVSMLRNYDERRWPVFIIGIRNYAEEPQAHMAVAILFRGGKMSIIDRSARYFTSWENLGGYGVRDIATALDEWYTFVGERVPDAQVYIAFSDEIYREFSGTAEFIAWAREFTG